MVFGVTQSFCQWQSNLKSPNVVPSLLGLFQQLFFDRVNIVFAKCLWNFQTHKWWYFSDQLKLYHCYQDRERDHSGTDIKRESCQKYVQSRNKDIKRPAKSAHIVCNKDFRWRLCAHQSYCIMSIIILSV